jgi:hypothetical protein
LTANTINVQGATASRYAFFDANRNLVAVNDPTTNLLTSSNTWTNTNQFNSTVRFTSLPAFTNPTSLLGLSTTDLCTVDAFSTVRLDGVTANNVTVNNTTANRLVLTNASKQLISSTLTDTDLVTVGTNQTITGVKSFTNQINANGNISVISNSPAVFSSVNITGVTTGTFERSQIAMYVFGATMGYFLISDSTAFSIFNLATYTARNIFTASRSNDVLVYVLKVVLVEVLLMLLTLRLVILVNM